MIGSLTCYNANNDDSATIQLTSLEEMWYTHEENVDHPEGSEYPVSINVPHMKVMRDRVIDSVLNRTGIDVRDFDSIIHASSSGPDYSERAIVRNV
jgi:predicted double-glycine peptidase